MTEQETEAKRKAIIFANLLAQNGSHNRTLLEQIGEQMDDPAIEALIAMGTELDPAKK